MRYFIISTILAAFFLCPANGMAAFEGPGAQGGPAGFSGPISGSQADTVEKALKLDDDAPVALTGNIESQIAGKKDKFIFKDGTGQIKVEIDRKVFAGRVVTPQDRIRISGKIDKDWGEEPEIDVKQLEILK